MAKRKKSSELLRERLEKELGIVFRDDSEFISHSPGHWQKSVGAHSWTFTGTSHGTIGSPDTVADCLKAKSLQWAKAFWCNDTIYAD